MYFSTIYLSMNYGKLIKSSLSIIFLPVGEVKKSINLAVTPLGLPFVQITRGCTIGYFLFNAFSTVASIPFTVRVLMLLST
ncbi:hypothetical protein EDD79_100534 [Serpentinicella alkaliphila]|uniref:Uncharacterized protein n=1 Tax=Serpentinicella alkaliphila TaxID=1734049 RepID=A0A4R2U514_9FIRM|nr:hypothetical protein EDD79_100534 [Serpentinicella alkaliphila]